MAAVHPIHRADVAYGPPEVHDAGSIPGVVRNNGENGMGNGNCEDGYDDTDSLTGEPRGDADEEAWCIEEDEFEREALREIGIYPSEEKPVVEEDEMLRVPFPLPIPRTTIEENELFERVMYSLRYKVAQIEEEEQFESSMRVFTHRKSAIEPDMRAGAPSLGSGEPNGAGLGEQPRMEDVRELLRRDVDAVWRREREKNGNAT